MIRKDQRTRGFSVVELVFVSFLATMISIGILLSISSTGYAQTRSELLFAADMILTTKSEAAFRVPYEQLPELAGEETLEQNGYTFRLTTTVKDFNDTSAPGVQEVFLLLSWEDRVGQGNRGRAVLRPKPW
jgi:hypothetical protein